MAIISCFNYNNTFIDRIGVSPEYGEKISSSSFMDVIEQRRNCPCKEEVRLFIEEADMLSHRLYGTEYSMARPLLYGITCLIGIGIPFTIKYFWARKRLSDLQSTTVNCLKLTCPIISETLVTEHYEYIERDIKFSVNPIDPGEHALEYLVYSEALKKNADAIIINYGNMVSTVSGSNPARDLENIYVSYLRAKG